MWILTLWRGFFLLTPPDIRIGDTTAPGYSGPLRCLNIDRLPFSPLRGLTVVERHDVLNGISMGPTLNALR